MKDNIRRMFQWNRKLFSLKCILFLVFGAIGSLIPFLPLHMNDALGLSKGESIIISIVAPLLASIGPLVAAPLADRLAGIYGSPQKARNGAYLRVMIAVSLTFATILYWLLLVIPAVKKSENVSFICNENGAHILQDRCGQHCYEFDETKGNLLVKTCTYACNGTSKYTAQLFRERERKKEESINGLHEPSSDGDSEIYYDSGVDLEAEISNTAPPNDYSNNDFEAYPHLCYTNDSNYRLCEVSTDYSKPIEFNIGLKPSVPFFSPDNIENKTCKFPTIEPFQCRIRQDIWKNLTKNGHDKDCEPVVICEIENPYNIPNSLLRRSQCGNYTFWLYIFIRSLADIFLATAVVLISTAVVIATRETSSGRGDVGKQYAAGAFGFAIFAPIMGGLAYGGYLESCICFTTLIACAVLLLILDDTMPLSPPEWWWHTRCGLLALPMSSVRKYGWEVAGLGIILFLLGVFWSSIDAFLPWYVVKSREADALIIGLTLTVGAIPAVIFLILAEMIVDYCGHNNILIFSFVNYICHHLGLMYIDNAWYILFCEWLELFSLHVMYITAILYLRHLIPRKYTACGQALPIVAHFCLGRSLGALFGGMAYSELNSEYTFQKVHQVLCITATCIAIAYFVIYHFYLKQKCIPPVHLPPAPAPVVVQSMNGNGSYTPLRVYHNSKSKKGHFRY